MLEVAEEDEDACGCVFVKVQVTLVGVFEVVLVAFYGKFYPFVGHNCSIEYAFCIVVGTLAIVQCELLLFWGHVGRGCFRGGYWLERHFFLFCVGDFHGYSCRWREAKLFGVAHDGF